MDKVKIASAAGFIATIVIGAMLLMNNAVHGISNVGIGRILAALLGEPNHVFYGWLAFLVIGIFICSNLYAFLAPKIPIRSFLVNALLFALVCWLILMVVLGPLAGARPFLLDRGHVQAAVTLVLSLVYWLVFSAIYRWLWAPDKSANTQQQVKA
jgi:hypothetical protein